MPWRLMPRMENPSICADLDGVICKGSGVTKTLRKQTLPFALKCTR